MTSSYSQFRKDLEHLINVNSVENMSNTPDFILAQYLVSTLIAFDAALLSRDSYYGVNHR